MLSAKYYIKDKQQSDLKCSFCFEANYQLFVCYGECKKQYCKSCINQFGFSNCHFCNKLFKVVALPLKKVEFYCSSQDCSIILCSEEEFNSHSEQCQLLPQKVRDKFKLRKANRCIRDHELQFRLSKTFCVICCSLSKTTLCIDCGWRYCMKCRPPPCSQQECPQGHALERYTGTKNCFCDYCGIRILNLAYQKVFYDWRCQLVVCETCFQKLPLFNPPQKRKEDNQQQ